MIFLEVNYTIGKHDNRISIRLSNKLRSGPPVTELYGKEINDDQRNYWDGRSWPPIQVYDDASLKLLNELKETKNEMENQYAVLQKEFGREPTPNEVWQAYIQMRLGQRTGLNDLIKLYIKAHPQLSISSKEHYEYKIRRVYRLYQAEYHNGDINYPIDRVNQEWIQKLEIFMGSMKKKNGDPYKASTLNKYMEKIIAMFGFAQETGMIKVHPFSSFKSRLNWAAEAQRLKKNRPNEMQKKISEAQLAHMERTYLPAGSTPEMIRCRLLALLQRWTGFSWADMEAYEIRNLITKDMSGNTVIMYTRVKTGILAILPLFPETVAILEQLGYNMKPPSYEVYRKQINSLLTTYIINRQPGDSSHLFRHMFGAMMLRRGFSIESVSKMMGHQSVTETAKTYAVTDSAKIHADLDKIQAVEKIIANDKLKLA